MLIVADKVAHEDIENVVVDRNNLAEAGHGELTISDRRLPIATTAGVEIQGPTNPLSGYSYQLYR
jgi:hypothetical protein